MPSIDLGSFSAEVELKKIKNIHLSVYPPNGRVRIAAPARMDLETIRIFAISKLGWIKRQQAKMQSQAREAPRDYTNSESHYYLGRRYLLQIVEHNGKASVEIKHDKIVLHTKPDSDKTQRETLLHAWYRAQLKSIIPQIISKWEPIMQVKVLEFGIKKMKTKWGTCNRQAQRIWINLELAKKPLECLEYLIVHEMTHLLERHHNKRFVAYMDKFLPQWPHLKEQLNRLPISHTDF